MKEIKHLLCFTAGTKAMDQDQTSEGDQGPAGSDLRFSSSSSHLTVVKSIFGFQ